MSNSYGRSNNIFSGWHYRGLLMLVLMVFAAFFTWAANADVDQQVRGVGRIIPAGKTRTIQHLEGGIIEQILVKEGQAVNKGDSIFVIENKKAESELRELHIALQGLLIRQKRLVAEQKTKTRDAFSGEFTSSFDAETRTQYAEIIEAEEQLFNARRQGFVEKINGLQQRYRQKELSLNDLRTQIGNLTAELDVAKEQLGIRQKLRDRGAISRSRYLETESQVMNFVTRIEQKQKEIPIVSAERDEILKLLAENQQIRQGEIIEELNDVKLDVKKLDERISAMDELVQRTEIHSPVNGVVNKLYFNTIGGVLQPGAELAEIIPVDETLIVEGRIRTDDRGKIWPGLPVVAKITAYDYSIYGGIDGELSYISADSFVDQQGQEYYQVRATLKSSAIDGDKAIFPGMTVELNIIAGKTTILNAILRPFLEIRDNAFRDA